MKKINNKGFTLIELLAVIVILGLVMGIAIPSISSLISNTKKDAYIRTAQAFIGGARNMAISDADKMLPLFGKKSYIALNMIKLEKGGITSPFGGELDKDNSYVMIKEVGTVDSPEYEYYILITEKNKGFGITDANAPLIETKLDTVEVGRPFVKAGVTSSIPAPLAGDIVCNNKICSRT